MSLLYLKSVNIGIIGYGYVGKAVDFGFKAKNKIFIHDKFLPSLSLEEVVENSQIIFICVPTPMNHRYSKIDLSIVIQVVRDIVKLSKIFRKEPIITIKSTVIPGTTKNLGKKYKWSKICFNPEFLTEANFLQDFIHADRIVIGGEDSLSVKKVVALYRHSLPDIPIFQTDSTTAEMVKYMANTYLAVKVIFANEMYDLCQALGINYADVKKMVVADKRIYDSHFTITDQRGFGGKCFPKDSVALLGLAKKMNIDLSVLKTAWKKNLRIRKTRDWEEIPGAVSKKTR